MMSIETIVLRFGIIFVLSFIFGLERQFAHKPIGFGTYIFVANGACALAIIAVSLTPENPLPLIGAIVTSVGFLGAGALIKTSDKIFGFTSAASIWIFAILGMAVGIGDFFVAGLLYLGIWIVVFVDRSFEKRSIGSYQKKFTIVSEYRLAKKDVLGLLKVKKAKTLYVSLEPIKKEYTITLLLEAPKKAMDTFPESILKQPGIISVRVE